MNTRMLEIRRPNGEIEILDVTKKFGMINQFIFDNIKKSTADAGRGEVLKAIIKTEKSNMMKLRKEYNDLYNEGADGYMPDGEYFKKMSAYKEWTETTEIK